MESVARGLIVGMVVLLALAGARATAADGRPMVTIGESNDGEQRRELLELFGVPDEETVVTVSVADTIAAMEGVFDLGGIESAHSSTVLRCAGPGTGLEVRTQHIEVVSPALYAMALVTAGIDDGSLIVGAPASAPAQGLTALVGVFRGWDAERCPSARTNETRQRLALEQIAVAVRAGEALGDPALATELVLRTLRTVVTEDLAESAAIDAAVAAEEAALGLALPDPPRADLVGFLTRLAAAKADWGAYADGWAIAPHAAGSGLTMTGAGEAADRVRAEATAEAAAIAAATTAAQAAETAAAAAPPPPPPVATAPTATAAAVVVTGEVFAVGDGRIVITHGNGKGPTVSYALDESADVTRNGDAAGSEALARGDRVTLTIPAGDSSATTVVATAAHDGRGLPLGGPWWLLVAIGVVVPGAMLYGGRWGQPFVVRAVAMAPPIGDSSAEAVDAGGEVDPGAVIAIAAGMDDGSARTPADQDKEGGASCTSVS